jgi:hypothetical protein
VLDLVKQHYLEMDRATQAAMLERTIAEFNATDPLLQVKQSSIAGISHRYPYGVFTKKAVSRGTVLCSYTGEKLDEQAKRDRYPDDYGRYVFELPDGSYIDAVDPTLSSIGRFVNSCGPDQAPNARMIYSDSGLSLVAETDLDPDQEILYDYGPTYGWSKGEQKDANDASSLEPDPQEVCDVAELEAGSMIIYKEPDGPFSWGLARVDAVDIDRKVVEGQQFGSYQYHKDPRQLINSVWRPQYTDSKDGLAVFKYYDSPQGRMVPEIVHVHSSDIMAHGFYLTNRERIPPPVIAKAKLA